MKKTAAYPGQTGCFTRKKGSTVARRLIGLPCGPLVKNPPANAGDARSSAIPGLGGSHAPQNYQVRAPRLRSSGAASPAEARPRARAPDKETEAHPLDKETEARPRAPAPEKRLKPAPGPPPRTKRSRCAGRSARCSKGPAQRKEINIVLKKERLLIKYTIFTG